MREECDIDDGDRTGGLANAKDRESLDLNVETATHGASGDSRDGRAGTRRGVGEPPGPVPVVNVTVHLDVGPLPRDGLGLLVFSHPDDALFPSVVWNSVVV